jgi:phosphoglycerol transferase MdoB-like AlkP superfamily enzyme
MKKGFSLFGWFFLAFIYFELLVRAWTVRPFFGIGLVFILLFSFLSAILLYAIMHLLPLKARGAFVGSLLWIAALFSAGQMVYHSYFRTYFTVFSMTQAGEVAHFWRDIFLEIWHCMLPITLILVVPITYMIFYKKGYKGSSERANLRRLPWWGLSTVVLLVAVLLGTGTGPNTPRDALFRTNAIQVSIPNLGVGPGMILDAGRLIFGFHPRVEIVEETPPEEGEVDLSYDYNRMDIDFAAFMETDSHETRQWLHQYFSTQIPTKQNEKTAIFKGKNLVFVCAEGFSSLAVHQKYTPTLYKMAHEGYQFTRFYNPLWGVSTSDGEYVQCLGLIPKAGVWSLQTSSQNWLPFTMGNQFSKLDYRSLAYHNHYAEYYGRTESHPNMGYTYKGLGTGLKVQEQWPESDLEMIQLTTPEFIGTSPWHVYYMTVSGHKNYNWTGNNMARKHRDKVSDLDMSENCKAYVACNIELDLAMEWLIQELDQAGELSNTVFAISGDHYPYGLTHEEIGEFLGHPVEPDFELYQSTFILWTPDMEPERVDKICSTLDIIPTLSNLFGLEYDSRLLAGRDIFSDASPLVMFANRSWITEEGRYNARTGVSEAFDQNGNGKKPAEVLSQGYMDYVNGLVANRFYVSRLILEEDYYRYVIPAWEAPVR